VDRAALAQALRAAGYEPAAEVVLACAALTGPGRRDGARALLLLGPPGAGKTALAEALATALRARYVYVQLHSWTSPDDLIVGVNVAAAVAGEADQVREPGVLALAAEASHGGPVVLCLDELGLNPFFVRAENKSLISRPGALRRVGPFSFVPAAPGSWARAGRARPARGESGDGRGHPSPPA
jgi:hypothetical protein